MSDLAGIVAVLLTCVIMIVTLDRLFRPRDEKLRDVQLNRDGAEGGDDGGGGD